MSYATYTTDAIVCGSKESNTADRSYLLFTKHAGMLWATARSVRLENSKQRFALQDFSIIRVSLVRGKSGWRVGSVESMGNSFTRARSRSERALVQTVIRNLRRFLHGEESVPAIFEDARRLLVRIGSDELTNAGDVFTLRLLHHLGYIHTRASFAPLLEGTIESVYTESVSAEGHQAIERAYAASHL